MNADGSLTQEENTRDSLLDQEPVKDMETGPFVSPLSGILNPLVEGCVDRGSVDRLDLVEEVQGEGANDKLFSK